MEEKGIELIDYLKVIWNKKWLIIIGTVLFVFLAAGIRLSLKPAYEIDAIIQPGKLFIEEASGNLKEVVIEEPQQIADRINHESFNASIAVSLGMDLRVWPKIKAERIPETLLARAWMRSSDIEKAKKILGQLIVLIKEDIDKKIDTEMKNIDASIKTNEIEIDKLKKEIEIFKNKLKILGEREKEILREMKDTRARIEKIETDQLEALKREKRSESETLGMLLYSNEIQASLRYNNTLDELLSMKKLEEENINLEIKKNEGSIDNANNAIMNLKERKGRMDYTKVVKQPTSSVTPVSPGLKLVVLLAGCLGLVGFVLFAFFVDYLQRKSKESLPSKVR